MPAFYQGLSEGSHVFRVRARDDSGQLDETPAERSFQVYDPPETTITSPKHTYTAGVPTVDFASDESAVEEAERWGFYNRLVDPDVPFEEVAPLELKGKGDRFLLAPPLRDVQLFLQHEPLLDDQLLLDDGDALLAIGQTASAGRLLTERDIPANEDAEPTVAVEPDETFTVTLSNLTADSGTTATLPGPATATVSVTDDDATAAA